MFSVKSYIVFFSKMRKAKETVPISSWISVKGKIYSFMEDEDEKELPSKLIRVTLKDLASRMRRVDCPDDINILPME